jgi:hypothetical protein
MHSAVNEADQKTFRAAYEIQLTNWVRNTIGILSFRSLTSLRLEDSLPMGFESVRTALINTDTFRPDMVKVFDQVKDTPYQPYFVAHNSVREIRWTQAMIIVPSLLIGGLVGALVGSANHHLILNILLFSLGGTGMVMINFYGSSRNGPTAAVLSQSHEVKRACRVLLSRLP